MNARTKLVLSLAIAGVVFSLALPSPLLAGSIIIPPSLHVTDGQFTTPVEWNHPGVAVDHFPVVGDSGGADLYVDQDATTLYLLYDALNSPNLGLNQSNSFFDVFFQISPEHEDYVVHIDSATSFFTAYEKDTGVVSPLNPDGSFDLTSAVWTPLDAGDLAEAKFQAAVTQAPGDGHLLAEFQLSLQTGTNPDGFYSPDPAFWSASIGGGVQADPPISSGIFTLNPDGTTIIIPALGAGGAPAQQPQDIVAPEPASLVLAALGAIGMFVIHRRRN